MMEKEKLSGSQQVREGRIGEKINEVRDREMLYYLLQYLLAECKRVFCAAKRRATRLYTYIGDCS